MPTGECLRQLDAVQIATHTLDNCTLQIQFSWDLWILISDPFCCYCGKWLMKKALFLSFFSFVKTFPHSFPNNLIAPSAFYFKQTRTFPWIFYEIKHWLKITFDHLDWTISDLRCVKFRNFNSLLFTVAGTVPLIALNAFFFSECVWRMNHMSKVNTCLMSCVEWYVVRTIVRVRVPAYYYWCVQKSVIDIFIVMEIFSKSVIFFIKCRTCIIFQRVTAIVITFTFPATTCMHRYQH